jgi:hypothetical protein
LPSTVSTWLLRANSGEILEIYMIAINVPTLAIHVYVGG